MVIDDEFRFLASDAQRVGRVGPLPLVDRVSVPVSDDRRVSALRFHPDPSAGEAERDSKTDETGQVRQVSQIGQTSQVSQTSQPGEKNEALQTQPFPPAEFVMLHGAGLNAHSFDPTILALDCAALDQPALSLDLPGHGRSDWRSDGDYRPDLLAPDVVTAIEQLAPAPINLVGHSLGGLTAALVAGALTQPTQIAQLIIIDITPGISPSTDAGKVTEFITGQRDYATVDEIVDRAISFGIGSNRASLTRGVALNTRRRADGRLEWTHHLAHLNGLPTGDPSGGPSSDPSADTTDTTTAETNPRPYAAIWETLRSLQSRGIPITLIRASSGMVSETLAAEWHEKLPGTEIITVEGPHNLHEAAPIELARILRDLAEQASPASH